MRGSNELSLTRYFVRVLPNRRIGQYTPGLHGRPSCVIANRHIDEGEELSFDYPREEARVGVYFTTSTECGGQERRMTNELCAKVRMILKNKV